MRRSGQLIQQIGVHTCGKRLQELATAWLQEPEGDGSEQQWAHAQFRPLLHDVIEELHTGKLSEDEFPSVSQRLPPSETPVRRYSHWDAEAPATPSTA